MTISAKIIKDSISPDGVRLITYELDYPRIIHSELMTHRVFSRNSASSRAIPVSKVIELVESNPAMPVHWGKNQAGMQADEELDALTKESVRQLWLEAAQQAVSIAKVMNDLKAHKQVVNRILEPFQHMKVVVTATEWNNWFWLRNHKDADPTIKALAAAMWNEFIGSSPTLLRPGQWHLPYVKSEMSEVYNEINYFDHEDQPITLEQARMVSASCCAQTSYRKTDGTLEKAEDIFKKLVESEPCHASPVEHQATPIHSENNNHSLMWDDGITHITSFGELWSNNFKGWLQFRALIPNNVKLG